MIRYAVNEKTNVLQSLRIETVAVIRSEHELIIGELRYLAKNRKTDRGVIRRKEHSLLHM